MALLERNMRVHLVIASLVLFMSVFFQISQIEWIIVTMLIALVFTAETFNTAIEKVCDENRDVLGVAYEATRDPRDISAGAVLMISLGSAIVGLIIFAPKVMNYISSLQM